jgi:hypothetical protein|tara:strand:- start:573 stop:2399 length:1827 start_codon:yes stop_codon:yes gene_type:complete
MALKKNFFKGLQGGVNHSPIKMHNANHSPPLPGPAGIGANLVNKAFSRLLGNKRTEEQEKNLKLNENARQMTTQEVINTDPKSLPMSQVDGLKAPVSQEDYNAAAYIRPYDNNSSGKGLLSKALDFGYNNPNLLDFAMKIPGVSNLISEKAKSQMKKSEGASKVNLDYDNPKLQKKEYENYKKEFFEENSYIDSLKNLNEAQQAAYLKDYGIDIKSLTGSSSDSLISEEDFRKSNIPTESYDGTFGLSNAGHWSTEGNKSRVDATPIDQFWSKKDLYKLQEKYNPKSNYYDWQKTYSLKGDDFDRNKNNKDISTNQAYEFLFDTDPNFEDNYEQTNHLGLEGKLTNEQMVPFILENTMINNPYSKNAQENYFNKNGQEAEVKAYGGTKNNPFMDKVFNDLYAGKGGYFDSKNNKYVEQPGPMYGSAQEDVAISNLMNNDYGRSKVGFGVDDKLPFMSISDSWDFQTTGKGGYNNWSSSERDVSDEYKQAQLVNQVSQNLGVGGFKQYDRFNFTPDKYRDYIPDNDVNFMQQFYGSNKYDNDEEMRKNNPNWVQPEMGEHAVVNAKRGNKKKLSEAELDKKYGKVSPLTNKNKKYQTKINISKRNVLLD